MSSYNADRIVESYKGGNRNDTCEEVLTLINNSQLIMNRHEMQQIKFFFVIN